MNLKLTQCVLAVMAAANFGAIAAERSTAATTNPPASDKVICARVTNSLLPSLTTIAATIKAIL